jgi:hypothetical protein
VEGRCGAEGQGRGRPETRTASSAALRTRCPPRGETRGRGQRLPGTWPAARWAPRRPQCIPTRKPARGDRAAEGDPCPWKSKTPRARGQKGAAQASRRPRPAGSLCPLGVFVPVTLQCPLRRGRPSARPFRSLGCRGSLAWTRRPEPGTRTSLKLARDGEVRARPPGPPRAAGAAHGDPRGPPISSCVTGHWLQVSPRSAPRPPSRRGVELGF